jgi:hypothetical protein
VVAGKKEKRKRLQNMWKIGARRVMKQKNLKPEDLIKRITRGEK